MKFIVTGHGHFATGLASAAQLISGESGVLTTVDFVEGMSGEQLRTALQSALTAEATVIFTDLLGGAPFREAVLLSQGRSDVVVVAGATVQLLLEALLSREEAGADVKMWVDELLNSAREGVTAWHQQQAKRTATSEDEGI